MMATIDTITALLVGGLAFLVIGGIWILVDCYRTAGAQNFDEDGEIADSKPLTPPVLSKQRNLCGVEACPHGSGKVATEAKPPATRTPRE